MSTVSLDEEQAPFSSVESWNPDIHSLDGDIIQYIPGRTLHFRQQKDWLSSLFASLIIFLFSWFAGFLFGHTKIWMWGTLSVVGTYFLVLWKMGTFNPVGWRFSFANRTLFIESGEDSFRYSLADVKEVWLKLEVREQWWSSALSGSDQRYRYASYNAQTMLSGLLEGSKLVVASTGFLQRDAQEVEHMGLCFAWMLADVLDVPLRIEESSNLETGDV